MKRSTIKDVAAEAGVSETAVSLAFREGSRLSDATRERVLRVARELRYAPNQAARNLRQGRGDCFGFVVNDVTNPFYGMMFREAERLVAETGHGLLFAGSDWRADREERAIRQMVQANARGVMVCLCERGLKAIEILDTHHVPYVAVDSYPDGYRGPYVANDFKAAATLAAEHLARLRCRRPAFFTVADSARDFSAFARLESGFAVACAALGMTLPPENVVTAGLTVAEGVDACEAAVRNGATFDAAFCVNDLCAMGVMEAAERRGRRVGDDLMVIGIDDIPAAALSRVSLTTIRQPFMEIAREAAAALTRAAQTETVPDIRQELAPALIVRGSAPDKYASPKHKTRKKQ